MVEQDFEEESMCRTCPRCGAGTLDRYGECDACWPIKDPDAASRKS